MITRRDFLARTALVAVAGGLLASMPGHALFSQALAQTKPVSTPSAADLAEPGPLGDMTMGDDKAPVTVIEYASMTCSHCAHFQATTFPELKKRYIDTGKVRYILREFPLDPIAAGAFMLARCAGKDKYYPLVDAFFAQQANWAVAKPLGPMLTIAKQAGFTEDSFKTCLADQKVLDGIEATRQRAVEKFGVNSTPTFFINGKMERGDISIEEMAKVIDPYLKAG